MPFGLQPWHIIVIAIVALLVFGPSRLPDIGRGLGRALREFRSGTREMTESFRDEISQNPSAPSPSTPTSGPANPPAPSGRFCSQCGAANPVGARFCSNCGAQLAA
jgi:sec-independent protein translocase protein TatA